MYEITQQVMGGDNSAYSHFIGVVWDRNNSLLVGLFTATDVSRFGNGDDTLSHGFDAILGC
ncbi:hypothetical protein [Lyngbya sp. PCC 8106]|uniref:hypothetical protein n=1 Tax=Lyngbya sp. (strain PCC 8106) TaxID=313612 RepID=UPI0000EAABCF|nr:hypothetical protein [Lyngbya sp. PCC 8106]EAW37136.1 hypothetical protein L8106_19191 [Lyngbya sp. PCC 8106]